MSQPLSFTAAAPALPLAAPAPPHTSVPLAPLPHPLPPPPPPQLPPLSVRADAAAVYARHKSWRALKDAGDNGCAASTRVWECIKKWRTNHPVCSDYKEAYDQHSKYKLVSCESSPCDMSAHPYMVWYDCGQPSIHVHPCHIFLYLA